ncbi:MAG: alpha-amylase family protein, partial [Terriglobia bacterium]
AKLPSRWWEHARAVRRMTLKRGTAFAQMPLDPARAALELDRLRNEGISVLEVFAPEEGGHSFDGLDAINRFRIEPELGAVNDFRRLVQLTHQKGLTVITFENFGYSS